jgi:hypothetical protein
MAGVLAVSASAVAADDPVRNTAGGRRAATFNRAVSADETVLIAEGARVRFEQHAGERGMWFRIDSGGDVVRVRLSGSSATVARGNREVIVPRDPFNPARLQQVARLLERSAAARALDALVRELTPSADEGVRGLELAAVTLRALQGDGAPAQALARRLAGARSDRQLVRAMADAGGTVNNCYDEWLRDTSRYLEEYFACEEAMRWLPLGGSLSCTYEWLFKITISNSILVMCVAS